MQLHRDRDEFDAAGVTLTLVGQGTPAHAAEFLRDQDIEGLRLLVDPKRDVYKAVGARTATVSQLLGPQVALRAAKAVVSERVFQGRVNGHPTQLGAVLVVAPGGEVAWSHIASNAGDNPPNPEVLEAARAAAAIG